MNANRIWNRSQQAFPPLKKGGQGGFCSCSHTVLSFKSPLFPLFQRGRPANAVIG